VTARKRLANRAGVERSQARTSGDGGYAAGQKGALIIFAQKERGYFKVFTFDLPSISNA